MAQSQASDTSGAVRRYPTLNGLYEPESSTHAATDRTPLLPSRAEMGFSDNDDDAYAGSRSSQVAFLSAADSPRQDTRRNLKTFPGVFSPVALSMFSTVLFLRLGFIVGQTGIILTIVQFVMAYFILYLTILSICAISTNGAVEGGGAYYMISRALGPEFGGSIGLLFYLANILACALYISGFVEGLLENFGPGGTLSDGALLGGSRWWTYLYASVVLLFCFFVCIIGGSMFARTSVFILVVVQICVIMVVISMFVTKPFCVPYPSSNNLIIRPTPLIFNDTNTTVPPLPYPCGWFTGLSVATFHNNTVYNHYRKDYTTGDMMSFAKIFAILFSSVTGIMNGANMSGELKDPSRSIPRGTLSAPAYTFTTYIILAFFLAFTCERDLLVNQYIVLQPINLWPPFVLIGIFSCTISAALGNLIGASRILEAVARDEVFWSLLKPAKVTTRGGNPYVAVMISWFLVQLVLIIGSLNAIAPLASAFFLLSYAATNLACLGLDIASAPNFRPTFKWFSWHSALLGLITSVGGAFLVSALYASVGVICGLLLVITLHLRSFNLQSWGSISQALIFHQVRKYLLILDSRKDHIKFWRPQMLLLVRNPRSACNLIEFVNDIKKGGLYVLGHVKVGDFSQEQEDPCQRETAAWLALVDILKLKAFPEVTMATSVREGMRHLARISGLGGMKPNTACFGFYDDCCHGDELAALLEVRAERRKRRLARLYGTADAGKERQLGDGFPSLSGDKELDSQEYVGMLLDVLKMNKNLCVCRGFSRLNKADLRHQGAPLHIDVWPVDWLRPHQPGSFDTTCLFMLQLACILRMVPPYKHKAALRVFLCTDVTDLPAVTRAREQKLECLLKQLRIVGEIRSVTREHVTSQLQTSREAGTLSKQYLEAVNRLIKAQSLRTLVTFLYLPPPPPAEEDAALYLQELAHMTDSLPATVMVHGLHAVTSTTL